MTTTIGRRGFLGWAGLGAAAVFAGTGAWQGDVAAAAPREAKGGNPFTLGVASGDPAADSVVLWTKLAPEPFAADGRGGMPDRPVVVLWEVADDERMTRIVRRGQVVATPALGHAVHPEVRGLAPDRCYFYRFRVAAPGGAVSPVGRTRTTPKPSATPAALAFAFASCQRWQDGYYTAYDHMVREDLDLVVFLGDYIYESELKKLKRDSGPPPGALTTEPTELVGYRNRYALHKSEAPLQAAHAAFPWIAVFDDHEVENNWAGDISEVDGEPDNDPAVFRKRRADAFRAYYEHLPLRAAQTPKGPDMRLYRRLSYGTLAEFTMLDTRQYRDDQACGDSDDAVDCTERFDERRTILGAPERQWLLDGLTRSQARWKVLGNQVPMGQTDSDPGPPVAVSTDAWDGYVADRNRLLGAAADAHVSNLVVITGDRHENYAGDLLRSWEQPGSPVVASEFVGTSITSKGDGQDLSDDVRRKKEATPTLKFVNDQRGYVRVDVTPDQWRSSYRVLDRVQTRGGQVSTRAVWAVENGRPGVVPG
ncbi:alkaline phosphatase D family protein [Pseudonocardia phyllosphaerae]|uniref:alkaline phosphatase D family protein n=1 Tax=Pseudonocardia phyllosphaerae TaxID=3390502 RepID=UPI00397863DF